MATVLSAVDNCFSYAGSSRPKVIDKWHAVDGKIKKDDSASSSVAAPKRWEIRNDGVFFGDTMQLTVARARKHAAKIDELYAGSDHADVWDNKVWTAAYLSGVRGMTFVDQHGNSISKQVQTTPCHNCGIILPRDCIDIDHNMPKVGGEDLYTIKMLRSLSLTLEGPTGGKGLAILNDVSWRLFPRLRERGKTSYNHLYTPTPGGKWSTNDAGTAFLSLLASQKKLDDLRTACKNSMLNLSPLCRSCNGVKSDFVRPIG